MKYEVYNPVLDEWQKVPPKLYKFLTKVRKYQGVVTKPVPEENNSEEVNDERVQ